MELIHVISMTDRILKGRTGVNIYYESINTECLRIQKYYSINLNKKEQQNT
jgi:hypothetical protein